MRWCMHTTARQLPSSRQSPRLPPPPTRLSPDDLDADPPPNPPNPSPPPISCVKMFLCRYGDAGKKGGIHQKQPTTVGETGEIHPVHQEQGLAGWSLVCVVFLYVCIQHLAGWWLPLCVWCKVFIQHNSPTALRLLDKA